MKDHCNSFTMNNVRLTSLANIIALVCIVIISTYKMSVFAKDSTDAKYIVPIYNVQKSVLFDVESPSPSRNKSVGRSEPFRPSSLITLRDLASVRRKTRRSNESSRLFVMRKADNVRY